MVSKLYAESTMIRIKGICLVPAFSRWPRKTSHILHRKELFIKNVLPKSVYETCYLISMQFIYRKRALMWLSRSFP